MSVLRTLLRAVCAIAAAMILESISGYALAEHPCSSGGEAVAHAYIRMNPIYEPFFGSVESFVSQNWQHFQEGGNAVRCAGALSAAAMSASVRTYDPADIRSRQELEVRLSGMGIRPGPRQPTGAEMLYSMSLRLARLARSLPAATRGDYGPLYTPANEIERMEIMAVGLFREMMRDPSTRSAVAAQEDLIREAAQLDYRIIFNAARNLAQQ